MVRSGGVTGAELLTTTLTALTALLPVHHDRDWQVALGAALPYAAAVDAAGHDYEYEYCDQGGGYRFCQI